MKKFLQEFEKFIMRGNVIDLAVGVIIGGAFQAIVNSLVSDVISPLLGMIGGTDFSAYKLVLRKAVEGKEAVTLNYGSFITAVINFIIMAFIIFLLVRIINRISELGEMAKKKHLKGEEEEVPAPTTKVCPFCKSEIAIDATRCPHCTSELDK